MSAYFHFCFNGGEIIVFLGDVSLPNGFVCLSVTESVCREKLCFLAEMSHFQMVLSVCLSVCLSIGDSVNQSVSLSVGQSVSVSIF